MPTIRFIGDVHGKFKRYEKIIAEMPETIQVGDMGVGFFRDPDRPHINPPYDKMVDGGHRFIRGNHDNPSVCRKHSQWIADGRCEDGMMFIGGGVSVDRAYRTEGLDWWPDEELSAAELNDLVDAYRDYKPEVMVTHEAPESIAEIMCALSQRRKLDFPSRTRQAFEAMLGFHSPHLWIFGHWHYSFRGKPKGETEFICLNELEFADIKT